MKNLFIILFFTLIQSLVAQQPYAPSSLSAEDYAHAEQSLYYHANNKVYNSRIIASWSKNKFIYSSNSREATRYYMVDIKSKKKSPLFTPTEFAKELHELTGIERDPSSLQLRALRLEDDQVTFNAGTQPLSWNLKTKSIHKIEKPNIEVQKNAYVSPDETKAIFIKDYNLWVQDLHNGGLTQLTTDGIENFGYGTNNAGWTKRPGPVLLWSPDSKKIATFQHDGRGVGEMYMVSTQVGHPELQAWKYPLPGDSLIFRIERVIINVENKTMVRLNMPPDMHRSSITDHIALRGGQFADVEWSDDSEQLSFVSSSRDHKEATLRIADIRSGDVKDIIYEKVETFFESGMRSSNWRFLPESNEVIWYSRRSDWGHIYLYDLSSGKLKNQITSGNWNVSQILKIDNAKRTIYFTGMGKESGDPYYQYFYKVGFDGQNLKLLTPESANHNINLDPNGAYFIDNFSTPQTPPMTNVRDVNGNKVMDLEKSDISDLLNTGWIPPLNVKVKARDEKTDLYGLLFRPRNFDENKKYPIINYIYPGPQSGSVGSRNFSAARRDNQAIADLGFIVVSIDAMGTPGRSKSFHEAYYGNMGDNGLPDQITGMEQLAEKYRWIDLERAGIYGHSGGGFASTDAILRYPDFFDVAVSGAGNHDNRNYEDDWGEKWQGLLKQNEDGTTNYDNQANQLLVENLKGKLLLAHGTLDGNVPVSNTMLVADRLIAANKDFDLILFPNRGHGFGNEPYMMRKRWDYFVQNLLGATPPKEFKFRKSVRP